METIQKTIKQLSRNTKIKHYRIPNNVVRWTIAEWLKHCGYKVRINGEKIVFK